MENLNSPYFGVYNRPPKNNNLIVYKPSMIENFKKNSAKT